MARDRREPRARRALGFALTGVLSAMPACSSDADAPDVEPLSDGLEVPASPVAREAEWANPVTVRGERIATLRGHAFQVDVYQVAVFVAEWDAGYRDARTGEPAIRRGDRQVVLNYVFTHTGEAITRFAVKDLTLRVTDPAAPSVPTFSLTIPVVYAHLGLNANATDPALAGKSVLWEPGTSFAVAQNVPYRPGERLRFSRHFAPSDVEGRVPDGAAGDDAEADASPR